MSEYTIDAEEKARQDRILKPLATVSLGARFLRRRYIYMDLSTHISQKYVPGVHLGEVKKELPDMLFESNKKRILIADDSKDFLSITRALLEFAGFNVETAEDGEEALERINRLQYDLLVLGVVMPRVEGIRFLQMVRNSKEYAGVPVIFVTVGSDKKGLETRVRETAYKAEGYIRKPFKNEIFLEMVSMLLRKKRGAEAKYN